MVNSKEMKIISFDKKENAKKCVFVLKQKFGKDFYVVSGKKGHFISCDSSVVESPVRNKDFFYAFCFGIKSILE